MIARRRSRQPISSHEVRLLRLLTDRGSEYCGNPERHEYELYLAIEDIDHSRTKTKSNRQVLFVSIRDIFLLRTSDRAAKSKV